MSLQSITDTIRERTAKNENYDDVIVALLQRGEDDKRIAFRYSYPKCKTLCHSMVQMGYQPAKNVAWQMLMQTCTNGDVDFGRFLIEKCGADVNAIDKEIGFETPLMWAAHKGQANVVEMLLEHGADVEARDHGNNYIRAIDYAKRNGNTAIVDMLQKKMDHLHRLRTKKQ